VFPWLTRSFTESTKLGGRFYGSYQSIESELRKYILIDGEPTVELDYKALHMSLLYAREGLPVIGDPYHVEGFERNLVKLCTLQLVNSDSISSLKSRITRSGQHKTQALHASYVKQHKHYIEHGGKAPRMPRALIGFVPGVPLDTDGSALVEALLKRHEAIAHHFGQTDIGLKLQSEDGEIMGDILARAASMSIPVLPVHDSVRCRASDAEAIRHIMLDAYRSATGQLIAVEDK
jgi:hypothetical protein